MSDIGNAVDDVVEWVGDAVEDVGASASEIPRALIISNEAQSVRLHSLSAIRL